MSRNIHYKVILQARTSSKRFAGKAMKKICNMPLVLLCAKRLKPSNKSISFVIATTKEKSDDKLVTLLKKYKFKVFRGEINDVLSRFYIITKKMRANDVVIRATADNPIPDIKLILELKKIFEQKKVKYMCLRSPKNKLPYGLSLEFIKVDLIREIYKNSKKSTDREHINPWIDRNIRSKYNVTNEDLSLHDLSKLRCTIDYKEDLTKISKVFNKYNKETIHKISWYELINELFKLHSQHTKICFGTANLDQKYGLKKIKIKNKQINFILKYLKKENISFIDTARSYGNAEKYFKDKKFKVISKLEKFNEKLTHLSLKKHTCKSIHDTYKNIGNRKIHSLLIHDWKGFKDNKNKILKILLKKKSENKINSIGASVYHPKEANDVINDNNFTYLQIPFNILDHRFNNKNFINKIIKRKKNISVYARSIFLQGFLLKKNKTSYEKKIFSKIDGIKKSLNIKTNFELCLKYINSFFWINYFIVGVENYRQIKQINLFMLKNTIYKIPNNRINEIKSNFKKISSNIILPYKWSSNESKK